MDRTLPPRSRLLVLSALALALLVAGLLPGAPATATPAAPAAAVEPARVRVVHASPDFGPADIYVDGDKVLSNVPFFTVSDYLSLPAGSYDVAVIGAGQTLGHATDVVFDGSLAFDAGTDYSVVARGTAAHDSQPLAASVFTDDNSAPAVGQARIRVAHLSPDAPAVDIYVDGARVLSGLSYPTTSAYLDVPAGSYTVGVAPANGSIIATFPVTLGAGQVITAWANGLLAGTGAQAFTVTPTIDAEYTGVARVRAVHAVPDIAGSPVDVYVNGAKIVTFDFFAATPYLPLYAATYDVRVVLAGGDPATEAVIQADVAVAADTDYSIVARGTASEADSQPLTASVFTDDNRPPTVGEARVRVAHLSPDAPAVDIYVDGAKVLSGLSYPTTSAYLDVPAGSYTVGVAPANGSIIATFPVTLGAGQVITAWANGLLAGTGAQAFTVTPTIDAEYTGVARVRAVHAVPDIAGSPVDVYVNDAKIATFDFFAATPYLPLYAATYDVRVVLAGGDPATEAVIQADVAVAADTDYSIVARGTASEADSQPLTASVFTDDNSAPALGQARIRVAHLSPDAPAVDIYVDGAKVLSGLSYPTASGYLDVPAGSYTVGVAPANGSIIATFPFTVTRGQVITAWANGLLAGTEAQAFKVSPTIDAEYPTFQIFFPLVEQRP